ncbi:hypothetical protein NDU88_004624 [Pleurodeles waltl]|uniref:Uncharacterized protein n=1 Tax=Pleurodeles waltl TaxID=8319 RepID=A0AAV7MEI7_PLEWA|nr:hypothetical protein NDU88_004624 [Pleurodeles waltl]
MGKIEKMQTKLQSREGCREEMGMVSEDQDSDAEPELRHILAAMQSSFGTTDGTIDSLLYRMDRMFERLDKQVERVDEAECRIAVVEDD